MSTLILEAPVAVSTASKGWIISKREDLTWFIGSSFPGYALLALVLVMGTAPPPVVIVWSVLLNVPHVFSTSTRALFDGTERRRIGILWLALIPLSVVAPLLTLWLGNWSLVVLAAMGHYHVSKQHMGFAMLYRAKAREREGLTLDKKFALYSLMLPLGYYFFALLGSNTGPVLAALLIAALVIVAFYTSKQIGKSEHNRPKLLLLAVNIPLTWLAFIYAASDTSAFGRLAIAVIVTNIPHSFQYLRLMWFHNHNRYAERRGVLGVISRSAIYFFVAVMLISLPSHFLHQFGQWTAGVAIGFLLFHYIVDAKLWRIRGDKELAAALRLS